MSSVPHTPPGLLGTVAAGYRLAYAHRRRLRAVLLPVLTAAVLALFAVDLMLGRDRTVIVNGAPIVDGSTTLVMVEAAVTVVSWLVALLAATLAVTAAARGPVIGTGAAIRAALRRAPVVAAALGAVAAGTVVALWVVAVVATGMPATVLVLGVFTAAALLAAELLIGLVAVRPAGVTLAGARVRDTAGAVVLGGLVVPLALAWSAGLVPVADLLHPVVARVIGAVLVTGLVAVQAGLLAHAHLVRRDETGARAAVDPPVADAPPAGPPLRRTRVAVLTAAFALLAPAAVAVVNPFGAPTVRSTGGPGSAAAVAWPAGGHPVVATLSGAWFCDDDRCDRYVEQTGGPGVMDDHGRATISADGAAVVRAALTGGAGDGGPFVHVARCTREGCREAWVPVRASATESFGRPELAVAAAPDGSVWFGLAAPSENEEPGEATFGITFVRCPDVTCAAPERHRAGTVERLPGDDFTGRHRTTLTIGADGRPVLAVRTGLSAELVTCDPLTCANPRTSSTFAGPEDIAWAAPASLTGPVVTFRPGRLRVGEQFVPLQSGPIAPWSGAVTTAGSAVYVTAAEAAPPPGLRVTIGATPDPEQAAQPEHWRQVLWRCDPAGCDRRPLGPRNPTVVEREKMAVSADGRVVIVGPDRILLVAGLATG